MSSIKFVYENQPIIILSNDNEPLKNAFEKFSNKLAINLDSVKFLSDIQNMKPELTVGEMKSIMSNGDIQIIVQDSLKRKIKSNYNICPKCQTNSKLVFQNYKIRLYKCKCKTNHEMEDISLDEFEEMQQIKELDINCSKCGLNKSNDSLFYKCNLCNLNLCQNCNDNHMIEQKHETIEYKDLNYRCKTHYELYNYYCKSCHKDLCPNCLYEHKFELKHNIISLEKLLPDKKELLENFKNLENIINEINSNITEMIQRLQKVQKALTSLKNIAKDLIDNYNPHKRRYILLNNIKNFKYDYVIKDLNEIKNENDNNIRFKKIMDLCDKIICRNMLNIIYNINEEDIFNKNIKIFGKNFVKKNKDKLKILYRDKMYDLSETLELIVGNINQNIKRKNRKNKNNQKDEKIIRDLIKKNEKEKLNEIIKEREAKAGKLLSIKLIGVINNESNTNNQKSDHLNIIKITDIDTMFSDCKNEIFIPEVSRLRYSDNKDIYNKFEGTYSLKQYHISNIIKKENTNITINELSKISSIEEADTITITESENNINNSTYINNSS